MDPAKLRLALDDIFDQALLHHGFVAHTRDYEVIVHATADPATGIEPTELRDLFRYCVQANCTTTVPATIWRDSLDDRLITYETGVDLDGYVWGVNWQDLYPGAGLLTDSPTARQVGHGDRHRLPRSPHPNQCPRPDLDLLRPAGPRTSCRLTAARPQVPDPIDRGKSSSPSATRARTLVTW
jgi:hypothetical protein